MPDEAVYDPRFLQGISYFNECEFFETHEVWEELWADTQGASRRFYQGLIQVAVCLHHFGNGNLGGARKLFHSSRGYLIDYVPHYEGVDVEKLLKQLEDCCQAILEDGQGGQPVEIEVEKIPEIHLDPPPQAAS